MTRIHYAETPHGFEYGAGKVARCCSDERKGWVVLSLETPRDCIQIYITKTGKIRIHSRGGVEWKEDAGGVV